MSADEGDPDLTQDSESENYDVSVDDLIYAARYGILEDVQTLVTEYGVDVNGYSSEQPKWTALKIACINGHTDVVKFLVANGANVNQQGHPQAQGFKQITAIHYACRIGKRDIVELLLSKGASLHEAAEDGSPPIHIACQRGHVKLVNYLLTRGATVHDRDKHGNTLLMIAAGFSKYEMVVNLLKKGATVDYRSECNRTPLYMACLGGHNGIVSTLLAHGADVQAHEFSDSNPLYAACKSGHHEVVLILLAHGALVRGKDFSKWNLLHPACSHSHYEVVKTLLNHGAKVDSYDEEGLTPLHNVCCTYLCRSEFIPHLRTTNRGYTLKVLLEYGIDPNVLDKGGFTPFERVRASQWGLSTLGQHELAIMLEYGTGSGVACRVEKCDCKTTTLMCLYFLYRSLLCEPEARSQADSSFSELLRCIRDTYEMYFIKTRLAGIYQHIDEKAVEPPLEYVDWNLAARGAFRAECEAELLRMKTDLIVDTTSTYFSLLTRDLPALRHQQILGLLTSDGCAERYPIYGNMIYSSYVRLRRVFLEELSPGFFAIPSPPLPPECAEVVQRHLSEGDLINVVDVYRNYLLYLEKLGELQTSQN